MKKILFVIPSLGSGGAERVISTLSSELAAGGYDVGILLTGNSRIHYELSPKVQLTKLECEERYGHLNTAVRYIKRIRDIRAALKENPADVVISFMAENNTDVCLATMGMKVPVIVSERNDPAIDPAGRVKQLLRGLAYHRASGFVFQTPDAQSYFRKGIQDRSCIIYNPLTAKIPEPYEGQRDKRVVSVGRLHKQKNFPMLIEAFAEFSRTYPDYTLEIYGEGPLEESLNQLISEKGLTEKVTLKGFCTDVHEQIRSAAFFVMTSDFEGMPNALVEAMALGMPCISTDCRCGGPRMLTENGKRGLLIPTGDAAALAKAMETLAADPERAKALGDKAAEIKKQVDTQTVVDQWLAYIRHTIER